MHHIQRKILSKLMYAKALHYAEMRPAGVESNHFAYHLEQLIHDGFIIKNGRDYSLSDKGLALADRSSHETMAPRLQPHIITSIHLTDGAGQLLLYQHYFQPYLNLYGPPQGRTHYDEDLADAAVRELQEKTGLTGMPLQHRGMAYIHATKAGESISKLLAHVFSGAVDSSPALTEATAKGRPIWKNPKKLTKAQCMPGFKEIQKLLSQNDSSNLFFAEIEAELPA